MKVLYILLQSRLCEFICASALCLESLVSLVSSIPLGSYNLSACTSTNFPEPWGRDLMEKFCLGPSVHRSLALCILFSVGLCICSYLLQEEASLMMTEQTDL